MSTFIESKIVENVEKPTDLDIESETVDNVQDPIDLDIMDEKIIMSTEEWDEHQDLPCYIIITSSPYAKYPQRLGHTTMGSNPDNEIGVDCFYLWDKETDIFTWLGHDRIYGTKWIDDAHPKYKMQMGPKKGLIDDEFTHFIGHCTKAEDIMNNRTKSYDGTDGLYCIDVYDQYWWDHSGELTEVDDHFNFCFSTGIVRRLLTLKDNTQVIGIYLECLQAECG